MPETRYIKEFNKGTLTAEIPYKVSDEEVAGEEADREPQSHDSEADRQHDVRYWRHQQQCGVQNEQERQHIGRPSES